MANGTLAPTPSSVRLSSSSPAWLDKVATATRIINGFMRLPLQTHHMFHAGMYARSIRLTAGQVMTGAVLRLPTLLIVSGDATFITEEHEITVDGYAILPGSKGRQTVFVARSDVYLTMLFPTKAQTVDEAEREFTDDWESLLSRDSKDDTVVRTGE